jgi:hypothetical protein
MKAAWNSAENAETQMLHSLNPVANKQIHICKCESMNSASCGTNIEGLVSLLTVRRVAEDTGEQCREDQKNGQQLPEQQ